jgi:hypothetical protein
VCVCVGVSVGVGVGVGVDVDVDVGVGAGGMTWAEAAAVPASTYGIVHQNMVHVYKPPMP